MRRAVALYRRLHQPQARAVADFRLDVVLVQLPRFIAVTDAEAILRADVAARCRLRKPCLRLRFVAEKDAVVVVNAGEAELRPDVARFRCCLHRCPRPAAIARCPIRQCLLHRR